MTIMGNLFPNDFEHPDHKSIPSPVVEVLKPTVTAVAVTAGLAALCPVPPHHDVSIHEHEHVPHHELVDTRPVISISAFGSSSSSIGDDLSWMNNSGDVANQIALRRTRFDVYAMNPSMISAAVLNFASTSTDRR